MTIRGIGVDIADISRFRNGKDLASHILSPSERKAYQQSLKPEEFLASRFAVKESYFKASQKKVPYPDIEVRKKKSGEPVLYVRGKRIKAFLSISHDKEAIAVVVLYR
jgi:phosphopantetheine--protein transferase-like protein